jgi:hypothetical protein
MTIKALKFLFNSNTLSSIGVKDISFRKVMLCFGVHDNKKQEDKNKIIGYLKYFMGCLINERSKTNANEAGKF